MIDHLLWAVPDLEQECRHFAEMSGVHPSPGGRHPGVGTHNALVSLGHGCYLEVIAPDPSQDAFSGLGRHLEGIERPTLLTWCARSNDLERLAADARAGGLQPGEPFAMSRDRPDGTRLAWRLMFLDGHDAGLLLPFFIEWEEGSVHPSANAARGCELMRFVLSHPEPERLRDRLGVLGLGDVTVGHGPPGLAATLSTPRGPVALASMLP